MSLITRLIIMILFLSVLFFIGGLSVQTYVTQHYFEQQMQSNAQDTATSLGLSLIPYLKTGDKATMSTMINAIFDHGYYQSITLTDIKGNIIYQRKQPLIVYQVPSWFMQLIKLENIGAKTILTLGWRQVAILNVQSHPGFSYAQAWNSIKIMMIGLVIIDLLGMILCILFVYHLLNPLKKIKLQAEAICNREFPINKTLPRTPELRRVVEAMNKMSQKVKEIINESVTTSEEMRTKAYIDPVTHLANRNYFDHYLHNMVASTEEVVIGSLVLVCFSDLNKYNQHYGFLSGDFVLQKIAEHINEACRRLYVDQSKSYLLARLQGALFVITLANLSPKAVEDFVKSLMESLKEILLSIDKDKIGFKFSMGIADYQKEHDPNKLLSVADMALRMAQAKPFSSYEIYNVDVENALNDEASWQEYLKDIIQNKQLKLFYQNVIRLIDDQIIHRELFLRAIGPDGNLLTATAIIPMAERFNLVAPFDRWVIDQVIESLAHHSHTPEIRYAINLSLTTIKEDSFIPWLSQRFDEHPEVANYLAFELVEDDVIYNYKLTIHVINTLRKYGVQFGLDHFGRSLKSLAYIKSLKIDYVKIDGSFVHKINTEENHQFFVKSIVQIAHSLDILVIADNVETDAERKVLQELHVDGARGRLFDNEQSSSNNGDIT